VATLDPRAAGTVSGCLDGTKLGSTYTPDVSAVQAPRTRKLCWGPQQTLLLAKAFVLAIPAESFGIDGELKCTWHLPKKNTIYVAPGPAEQVNFFKVCPSNQKPWPKV
jgi:hypothetical protein